MAYFAQADTNGNIIAYYTDELEYPNGIPADVISITNDEWTDAIHNQGKYIIQNSQFVLAPPPTAAQQLASAQSAKISELRDGYTQTINSGFQVTIGGVQYTMGWATSDIAHLDATQTAVDRGYQAFPIFYSDISGNPLTLSSQTDLDTIEQTATKFAFAQHQQVMNLISQTQSAAAVDAVNAIVWTPGTY